MEEKEISEDLMEETGKIVSLESFVPRYTNQAITFTGEDMGGDKAMMIMLLYIIMVIMAFVFGITISNTIRKEAAVIGTLRASGYTRRELISHYMTLPVLVTLAGALAGNVLGYTVLKNVCAAMYYGSYSLPTYETVWNKEIYRIRGGSGCSDEDIPSAGCIYGKYDGNGKWICHHDLYGTDLSAVQDHY